MGAGSTNLKISRPLAAWAVVVTPLVLLFKRKAKRSVSRLLFVS